jgi:hypothetical protein
MKKVQSGCAASSLAFGNCITFTDRDRLSAGRGDHRVVFAFGIPLPI